MNASGWFFMVSSLALVSVVTARAWWKLLAARRKKD